MEMWIHGDRLGTERLFRVDGQATNFLHGSRTLYKRPRREARIRDSLFKIGHDLLY
jgi:hypothetical protein